MDQVKVDARRSTPADQLEVTRRTPADWLVSDSSLPPNDARRLLGHIAHTPGDDYRIVWLCAPYVQARFRTLALAIAEFSRDAETRDG